MNSTHQARRSALKIAVAYAAAAALWILCSDSVVTWVGGDVSVTQGYQTAKGILFVTLSSGLLFWLVHRELKRRARAEQEEALVVRLARDIFFKLSKDGRFASLNPAFEAITSFVRPEWMGRHFSELLAPEDAPRIQALLAEAMKGGNTPVFEARLRREDGSFFHAEITLSPEMAGREVLALHGVARDITAQHEARDRLAEKAALLDLTSDAILVCAMDHRVIYWNKGAERLFGWTNEEILGRDANETLLPPEQQKAQAALDGLLLQTGEWHGEMRQLTKDGRRLLVEARKNVVKNAGGNPTAVLTVITDKTERKALEEQIQQAQRMESIGKLAGGIAHDLNNILAPILIVGQILPSHTNDPELLHLMETLDQSARRGADVVKQILAFVRGSQGRRFMIQPKHLVKEIERFARQTFTRSMKVIARVPDDPWPMEADPSKIYQVLLNLCVNARDALGDGGEIRIELANVEPDALAGHGVKDIPPGPYVLLRVQDNGPGIPPEIQSRIFEPLFTTKTDGRGTGLGLSTVQSIVNEHKGCCVLSSTPGKGACFSLYFPASPGAMAAATGETPDSALLRGGGELILVVDDEEAILQVTSKALETHGYRVLLARNGVEAVSKFVEYRDEVRLLITDMDMPVMGGRVLVFTVRGLAPHLRVLVISGASGTGDVSRFCEEAGNLEYLRKPFNLVDLLREVGKLVHEHDTALAGK